MAIDSVQHIVATIRASMGERLSRSDSPSRETSQRRVSGKAANRQQRMNRLIVERIQALQPDDPNRGRKAFRIFLESVLIAEFGEGLLNDPAFYPMVDEIHRQMEADPGLASAITQASTTLLQQQRG